MYIFGQKCPPTKVYQAIMPMVGLNVESPCKALTPLASREGPHQRGEPRAPKSIKMALIAYTVR